MPQAASESYERWSLWRDHVSATFRAFLSDDAAAKRAGEYHVELMHRGLNQAGVKFPQRGLPRRWSRMKRSR